MVYMILFTESWWGFLRDTMFYTILFLFIFTKMCLTRIFHADFTGTGTGIWLHPVPENQPKIVRVDQFK